jgi:hypothetical protein
MPVLLELSVSRLLNTFSSATYFRCTEVLYVATVNVFVLINITLIVYL